MCVCVCVCMCMCVCVCVCVCDRWRWRSLLCAGECQIWGKRTECCAPSGVYTHVWWRSVLITFICAIWFCYKEEEELCCQHVLHGVVGLKGHFTQMKAQSHNKDRSLVLLGSLLFSECLYELTSCLTSFITLCGDCKFNSKSNNILICFDSQLQCECCQQWLEHWNWRLIYINELNDNELFLHCCSRVPTSDFIYLISWMLVQ